MKKHVVAIAGGVGGAKLAYGLYHALDPDLLTVIVNTGDDFEHLGLHISPDLDTVMYTLADLANPKTGWGLRDESWQMISALQRYGGPSWFNLGDQDMATHLLRTQWLREGQSLTAVTRRLSNALGIRCQILPMSDDPVRTIVQTPHGELAFQEYFVKHQCNPPVTGLRYSGAATAQPTVNVSQAIQQADLVVFCPSNPLLSIDPILAVPKLKSLLMEERVEKLGVSPIVGGAALKGPAAKMLAELGLDVSPMGVAKHLHAVLSGWVIDTVDAAYQPQIAEMGLRVLVTNTVMKHNEERIRLAEEVLTFA